MSQPDPEPQEEQIEPQEEPTTTNNAENLQEEDLAFSNPPSKPQTPLQPLSNLPSKPQSPAKTAPTASLTAELSYGCTFFSGARGPNNPFNVITPQALFQRLKTVNPISFHQAETLLREPFCEEGKSRNFAKTKAQRDVQLTSLCTGEIAEIYAYRTAQVDSIDIGLEAFRQLGARDENDVVAVEAIAQHVHDAYDEFQTELELIEDLQQHREYVKEAIEMSEKVKIESQGGTWNGKKWVDEKIFEPASVQDIMSVIQMAVGSEQYMNLAEFRSLFEGIKRLEFKDYRKDIKKASGKL